MKVLVTPTSLCRDPDAPALVRLRDRVDEVVLNPFGRPLTSAELTDLVGDVDGIVAGLDDYDADVFAAAPRLRVVARYGVGVDRVDLDAAAARGVAVTRTPGANAVAVAELTIGLMFAAARGIAGLDAAVRAGEWPRVEGKELAGATAGVIGFGAIGRLVAERVRGLGMTPIAFDPMLPDGAFTDAGVERVDIDELCRRSDVVTLHVPLVPETRHILDLVRLRLLPAGAIVVNTARGGLLDESAARRLLDEGVLHGVAVDVYESEPPTSSPLVGHPRVVATPHAGGHTTGAVRRMTDQSIDALLAVLGGQQPEGLVTPGLAPR
ncbi:phosphoglycerate dehydrogenase [Microbacterium sp. cf332]|uniref:phosphoglycerate dehydrogenase n=1 Tax=Microbacterium sp. cf332 TaxID=1761804 RepID=UPI000883BE60|nr:phosphoglycerate dehydrogenase [Microbacterium sp. cf332]SDQ05458.1 D-3-phosphoglycerate dehydrogenase [Microbacterium sp. cf332]